MNALNLPTNYRHISVERPQSAIVSFEINTQLSRQIQAFTNAHGVTLYTALLTAYNVLLYRYTGQEDICVGSPAAGQNSEGLQGPNDSFVNALVLRSQLNDKMTFVELLSQVKMSVIEAYRHQEVPVKEMAEVAAWEDDKGDSPVFQVSFSLQIPKVGRYAEQGQATECNDLVSSQVEIALTMSVTSAGIKGRVAYRTGLYTAETIERMISHYKTLLESIVNSPENKLGHLGMLTVSEEKTLLEEFNDTVADYPKDKNIVLLFEEQVGKTPDAIAVVFEDDSLSYRELNERSNRLAYYLQRKGVKTETLVPICIERGLAMIVAILGVLKSGGVYVPIIPDYPADRISHMLQDTDAKLILSTKESKAKLMGISTSASVIDLDGEWEQIENENDRNPQTVISPGQLAYVIYTSGSTGRPKGVMIEHRSVVNLITTQTKFFDIDSDERILQFSNYCFDASVEQIFLALFNGGAIIMFPEGLQLDAALFEEFLIKQKISHLHAVPTFLDSVQPKDYKHLKRVISGGDVCSKKLADKWSKNINFYNKYGPTETTVTAVEYSTKGNDTDTFVPIGKPLANVSLYILNSNQALTPLGVPGEIYIGGVQVARGYLNRPELTAEKFIIDPFSKESRARMYKTGDLGRWLPDGNIEYLGRIDDQVKIRGYRIELGEIENVLAQCDRVRQASVLAKSDSIGNKQLVGYVVPQGAFDKEAIQEYLSTKLPEYMVPFIWVELERMPLTTNGKVDKKNLPKPGTGRPELSALYKAPSSAVEKNITAVWMELLLLDKIGVDDNFFQLGGNSLLALKAVSLLRQKFGYQVLITKLYQYPTINGIANLIGGINKVAAIDIKKKKAGICDVAVIGMAGRFPGTNTIDEFWDMLVNGKETISFFSDDELDPAIPAEIKNHPSYVKARGVIDKAENFDAELFGFNSRAAELTDPQQRVFLEIAREVLESSGYLAQKYDGSVGIFAGCGYNSYYHNNVLKHPKLLIGSGQLMVRLLNEKDYIASRTAYQLNLKGPAVSVHSACSTSLSAIAQAVSSIREGQCDIAIAGAASITSPAKSGHFYEEEAVLSIDGHTRSFDAKATGTVFSDGAGVVLLKSLEDAEKDGDTIYAVIKGIGINNDGADKGSFIGPSAHGQAGAIAMAIHDAGIDPSSLSYVEAHGTATPLGDPIEIEGLNLAFGHQTQTQFCAIGSVKSNIGHLTAASGVAGFIKTALALHYRQIPPSLFYDEGNPNINLADSPFYVNTALKDWKSNGQRRAGVSSFGFGGTNVHVILEEYKNMPVYSGAAAPLSLISWSAKNENSVNNYAKKLASFIENNKDVSIADIAYSLQSTREDFSFRKFIIAANRDDLLSKLKNESANAASVNELSSRPSEIVFMFPGQGSQYINMGKELYENEPVFKSAVDQCVDLLKDTPQANILEVIYPEVIDEVSAEKIKNTLYTQPAIFIMDYAMAKLWMSWGVQPTIFTGHSIGEFVAAHFAGVFNLTDALHLVSARARMVSEVAQGSMLSARLEVDQLRSLLPSNISIAAVNSHKLCVVAGDDNAIADFGALLAEKDIPSRLLQTSHAFHSAMMDTIVAPFEAIVRSVKLNPPIKPIISTVTGKWMSAAEATSPEYWAVHLRKTVLFADAIDVLQENEGGLLMEVGPGFALATLARQQIKIKSTPIIQGFEKNETTTEYCSVLKSLGQLWLNGIEPNWQALYLNQQRLRINLPAYAYDHKRYWLDPVSLVNNITPANGTAVTREAIPLNEVENEQPGLQENITRKQVLTNKLKQTFETASGVKIDTVLAALSFIDIGFDSILLMQISANLKKEYKVPITIRKLFEEYNTIDLLAAYLDTKLPEEVFNP
jgi:amino acid adenylation domain-containing protein